MVGLAIARGGGSCAPAGLVAPAELDLGTGVLDGELDGTERLAEGLGRVAQKASTLGAGHADPLVAALQVDLAVVEPVVVVLAGGHHVAEGALIAHLHLDAPAGFEEEDAAGGR